ncbi:MAG: permease, partial [uncultured Solirubrobacteraceae bacterium]
ERGGRDGRPPRHDRPGAPRGRARDEAVDADRGRARALECALHHRLRALARRADPGDRRGAVRPVHRPRADRDGDGAGRLREQLRERLPGPLRPLPQRRARRAHARVAGQPRPLARRRGAGAADRRRAAGDRRAADRRAGPRAARAPRRGGADARAVLLAGRGRRDLRRVVGPHGVHHEPRDPPAVLPRGRLLLDRLAPLAVAGDLPREPGLLPDRRHPPRVPGVQRRIRLAVPRGHRGARRRVRRVEHMAVRHGPPPQAL